MIASSTNRWGPYNTNGVTVNFAYTDKIFAAGDLKVYRKNIATEVESLLVYGTDYTVTGVGSESGGNVVFVTAPETGYQILILREVDLTQETDIDNQGGFYPEVHEDALDKLTMECQQLQEQLDRCVKFSPTSGEDPNEILEDLLAAVNSSSLSVRSYEEVCATDKQTFTLDFSVNAAKRNLAVYISGVKQPQSYFTLVDVLGAVVTSGSTPYVKLEDVVRTGTTVEFTSIDYAGSGAGESQSEMPVSLFSGNLASAVSYIGAANKTIVIDQGCTLTANLTIPANICLRFVRDGYITLGAYNLVINGQILAGMWKIFYASGVGVVSGISGDAYPEWWGADSTGVTNSQDAIQAAVNTLSRVNMTDKNFRVDTDITMPNGADLYGGTLKLYGTAKLTAMSSLTAYASATNMALGDTSIVLTDATGLAVGDLVLLRTVPWVSYAANYTPIQDTLDNLGYQGEFFRIISIAGNTITLEGSVSFTYNFGTTSTIHKINYARVRVVGTELEIMEVRVSSESSAVNCYYLYDSLFRDIEISGVATNSGIYLTMSHACTVECCSIIDRDNLSIYLRDVCTHCRVIGNRVSGISSSDGGIFMTVGCHHNVISNNTISNARVSVATEMDGIAVHAKCWGNTIIGNTIHNVNFGLRLAIGAQDNVFANNSITGCTSYGVYLEHGHQNKFIGNVIRNCTKAVAAEESGIFVTSSTFNQIENNLISICTYGITLYSDNNRVIGNVISAGTYGIYLANASNTEISFNDIKGVGSACIIFNAANDCAYNRIVRNVFGNITGVNKRAIEFQGTNADSWFNEIHHNKAETGVTYLVYISHANRRNQSVMGNTNLGGAVINDDIVACAGGFHVGAPQGYRLYSIYANPAASDRTVSAWEYVSANVWKEIVTTEANVAT